MSLLRDLISLDQPHREDHRRVHMDWSVGHGHKERGEDSNPDWFRIRASYPSGTTTDPARVRLQGTTVKLSYSGPQAVFKDPFRRGNNILVMCDAYAPAGDPIPTNKRFNAQKIYSHPDVMAEEPWCGIEQEYTLFQKESQWPLRWPVGRFPGPQVWH